MGSDLVYFSISGSSLDPMWGLSQDQFYNTLGKPFFLMANWLYNPSIRNVV